MSSPPPSCGCSLWASLPCEAGTVNRIFSPFEATLLCTIALTLPSFGVVDLGPTNLREMLLKMSGVRQVLPSLTLVVVLGSRPQFSSRECGFISYVADLFNSSSTGPGPYSRLSGPEVRREGYTRITAYVYIYNIVSLRSKQCPQFRHRSPYP